jgi:hypothetical protein
MPPRPKKVPAPKKAFPLRIEPELWDALERLSAAEFRSANAQIECLLREALKRRGIKLAAPGKRPRGRPPKTEG